MVKGGLLAFAGFGIGVLAVIIGIATGNLAILLIGGFIGLVTWLYGVSGWLRGIFRR